MCDACAFPPSPPVSPWILLASLADLGSLQRTKPPLLSGPPLPHLASHHLPGPSVHVFLDQLSETGLLPSCLLPLKSPISCCLCSEAPAPLPQKQSPFVSWKLYKHASLKNRGNVWNSDSRVPPRPKGHNDNATVTSSGLGQGNLNIGGQQGVGRRVRSWSAAH